MERRERRRRKKDSGKRTDRERESGARERNGKSGRIESI